VILLSLFYDDFIVGQKFVSGERELQSSDIVKFAELTGDFNKLHFERNFSTSTGYKDVIVHGMLTLSIMLGLWHSLDLTNGTILAFAGLKQVSFKIPVYVGDKLHLTSEIASKRELRSRTNAGLVTVKLQGINQEDNVVLEAEVALIIKRK
jgi:acyl dehydratase